MGGQSKSFISDTYLIFYIWALCNCCNSHIVFIKYSWSVSLLIYFQERFARMKVAELRCLLEVIMMREPRMVFDLMQSQTSLLPGQCPPSPSSNPLDGWCICGHCREMPTDVERKCCRFTAPECLSITPVSSPPTFFKMP